jgi:hypothetical protein
MELCLATNFLGEPCPYTATIGDYCVLHAGGWDYAKANTAMLWAVHGKVTTLIGIITGIGVLLGSTRIVNVVRDSATRELNLFEMQDSAESVLRAVDLLSKLEELESKEQREGIENLGKTVLQLHLDVQLVVQHLAAAYQTAQAANVELEDLDSV